MRRVIALLAWTALVLTPLVSSAQIGGGGSIQGLVLDTSNLAVPGATVTGDERRHRHRHVTAQTTSAGVYALTPLPPGEYRVTVTPRGFQTVTREGIIVDALGVVGLNVTLQVAGIKQESSRSRRRRRCWRRPTPGSARRSATRSTPRCRS